jgi:broad specificity phosphatase PhoE
MPAAISYQRSFTKCFRDVVIVAHGHFNRCMIARWMNMPLEDGEFLPYSTSPSESD